MSLKKYVVAVDVGASRVKVGLVHTSGEVVCKCVEPIETWSSEPGFFEQSSGNIWEVICFCVRTVAADVHKDQIIGIAYNAKGSIVLFGDNAEPLSVSKTGIRNRNVLHWMDRRAQAEADMISATNHNILRYVGGSVSPEMVMPKLLWLKKNMYEKTYSKLWRVFDMGDFLTWRSTERDTRSLCSLCCNWNFDSENMYWSSSFLKTIGLEELMKDNFEILGKVIYLPGQPIGKGLCSRSATELNLPPGIVVATSMLHAYAGALGMLGCKTEDAPSCLCDMQSRMALICGTDCHHLSITRKPCDAAGICGPYKNTILRDYFVNEGGQPVTGLLLDFVIRSHPQYSQIEKKLGKDEHIYTYLNNRLEEMATERNLKSICYLTKGVHVVPDYLGNRTPMCDFNMRGMLCGLDMSADENSLAILYLAFVQALAYGTRQIIESLRRCQRINFESFIVTGNLAKNRVFLQTHADICGLSVIIPNEGKNVPLLGTAMLATYAAKLHESLEVAAKVMGGKGTVVTFDDSAEEFHQRKYQIFVRMLQDQRDYKDIQG